MDEIVHSSPFANQNCSQFGKIGGYPPPPFFEISPLNDAWVQGHAGGAGETVLLRFFCCRFCAFSRSVGLSFVLFFFLRRRQNCRVERMSWRERERASERAISGTLSQNPAAKLQEFVQYYNQSSCTHWQRVFHNFFRPSSCSVFLFLHNLFWVTSQEKNQHFFFPLRLFFLLVLFSSLCSLSLSLSVSLSLCACLFFTSLSPSLDLRSRDLIYIAHCWGCLYSRLYQLSWCSVLGLYTITALWLCWGSGVLLSLWAFFSCLRVLNFAVPKVFFMLPELFSVICSILLCVCPWQYQAHQILQTCMFVSFL